VEVLTDSLRWERKNFPGIKPPLAIYSSSFLPFLTVPPITDVYGIMKRFCIAL